ncbi:outer membrane protein assembly factor BamE [Orrella sp. 11846]|uniref:outer membrane protein assembly factor BamE n=1 Tax=Orrella sp. 11846 TaxID=3409913 RepID=UPI003B5C6503
MRSRQRTPLTRILTGLVLGCAVLTAGCSSDRWGFPYRTGTQQGNWITDQQVGMLFQGMTREQVRYALGTPMLTSVLHSNRWEYPYFYEYPNRKTEVRRFSVFFDGDLLSSWEGDPQPTMEPFQIAKEQVWKSQAEQAQVELDQERVEAPDGEIEIVPGVSLGSEVLTNTPSSEPFAIPGVPDQKPMPLE